MLTYIVYTDGATRPKNPGPSGYGAALFMQKEDGGLFWLTDDNGYLGEPVSNNQAEYMGVLAGLHLLKRRVQEQRGLGSTGERERGILRSDSLLVISQVTGAWALRSTQLGPLYTAVHRTLEELARMGVLVTFEHVRGHRGEEGNERVDALAGAAVDSRVQCRTELLQLIMSSQVRAESPKGHEKLLDLVRGQFPSTSIIEIDTGLTSEQRAALYRDGSPTAEFLLHRPSLLHLGPPVTLFALATGFKQRAGEPGVRTMDLAAYRATQTLTRMGLQATIVHRPHARGHWATLRELGWGDLEAEAPLAFFSADTVGMGEIFTEGGWPPFVELLPPEGR